MMTTTNLSRIPLGDGFNYIGVFLTFRCNYRCSYCINRHAGSIRMSRHLTAAEWIAGLNRLDLRPDLPLSFQGGEPTLHREFYDLVNGVRPDTAIDLLTNLQFGVAEFQRHVRPERLRRSAPYAPIRVSYHPQVMDLDETMDKALAMQEAGYVIGLFGVLHPDQKETILAAQAKCRAAGLDFRTKEFLGFHEGRLHGRYRYPGAVEGGTHPPVQCRNSEVLIDPAGFIYRCHHDVYLGISPLGHLLDPDLKLERRFRECQFFGRCNPCDIKVKNNRFQQFGHCSVEILGRPAVVREPGEEKPAETVAI